MTQNNMAHSRDFDDADPSHSMEGVVQDPRRAARILAMQYLHQLTVQKGASLELLDVFLDESSQDSETRRLARGWIRGAWQHRDQIDETIRSVSANWDLTRISLVDRSNLELAVYQLMFCPDIPAKAAPSTPPSPGYSDPPG